MVRRTLLLVLLLISALSAQHGFELHIKKLMSPTEFNAAGLSKLTPSELAKLDEWLDGHTERVIRLVAQKQNQTPSAPSTAGPQGAIETQIDGDFEGWDGETIFKLTNWQIWQQSSYAYTYHYAFMPKVIIYKASTCWKMKVEDVSDTICVQRIK